MLMFVLMDLPRCRVNAKLKLIHSYRILSKRNQSPGSKKRLSLETSGCLALNLPELVLRSDGFHCGSLLSANLESMGVSFVGRFGKFEYETFVFLLERGLVLLFSREPELKNRIEKQYFLLFIIQTGQMVKRSFFKI